jgi:hypothetical protein
MLINISIVLFLIFPIANLTIFYINPNKYVYFLVKKDAHFVQIGAKGGFRGNVNM